MWIYIILCLSLYYICISRNKVKPDHEVVKKKVSARYVMSSTDDTLVF